MARMRLVTEFENRPQLAFYAPVIAGYLSSRQSNKTSLSIQERFIAFLEWAERIEWEEGRPVLHLPVEPSDVARYILELDGRGLSLSTIRVYVSAIGTVHRALGLYGPGNHPLVKEALADLRDENADTQLRRAYALSEDDIGRVLRTLHLPRRGRGGRLETQEMAYRRSGVDRAILLTMIQAGLRCGEAANLRWMDVREYSDGSGRINIRSSRSGHDDELVPVTGYCLQVLMDIRPHGVEGDARLFELSGAQIARRLKSMCKAAGLDSEAVSGHTPRATLVRLMLERGAPPAMVQRQSRLRSATTLTPHIMGADTGEALNWL